MGGTLTQRAYNLLFILIVLLGLLAMVWGCRKDVEREVGNGGPLMQSRELTEIAIDVSDDGPLAQPFLKKVLDRLSLRIESAIAESNKRSIERNRLIDERNAAVAELRAERSRFWSHKQRVMWVGLTIGTLVVAVGLIFVPGGKVLGVLGAAFSNIRGWWS